MGMNMQEVVYEYREGAAEGSLPGVPLRDLTRADMARMSSWLAKSVEASPLYEKASTPRSGPGRRPSATKKDEDVVPVPAAEAEADLQVSETDEEE